MKEKKKKEPVKKEIAKKRKGKYNEVVKIDATFQELISMAASLPPLSKKSK